MKKSSRSATKPRRTQTHSRRRSRSASTSDILNSPAAAKQWDPSRIRPKWRKQYRNLLSLRAHVLQQIGALNQEATEDAARFSMHLGDAGTDSFDRDFALSLISSDQNALYEIDEALRRIENGTYGVCEFTGKAIPQKRLEAIPWARFTVEAQKRLEREGSIGRAARLGQLGSVNGGRAPETGEDEESEEDSGRKGR